MSAPPPSQLRSCYYDKDKDDGHEHEHENDDASRTSSGFILRAGGTNVKSSSSSSISPQSIPFSAASCAKVDIVSKSSRQYSNPYDGVLLLWRECGVVQLIRSSTIPKDEKTEGRSRQV